MFPRTPGDYTGPNPYGSGGPHPEEGMDNFYETYQAPWPGVEVSPYGGVNHPYNTTAAFPSNAILTPISLPDSSFAHARPSPVLSHHSQEYAYCMAESVPSHGLGITAPFPSDFPRTVTAGLGPVPDPDYVFSGAALSPPPHPVKRTRRSPKPAVAGREGPVTILPHPEGLQRLEQERRREQVDPHSHQRPRAPGRGRRDPQAEEEDAFVERLREQNLAWKHIREMFREKFNKDASEARLQMRMLRRRKDRSARWEESDVNPIAHKG
ncbi:hypothetical protein BDV27DRAFT_86415 [Aspergillus caelatus]|uniref:Uncharacterized protein n=1 Tax=Aspergillus caelatus TaxID=61420 RepID=A0A5N6ZIF7_9EURO|nr:uncharacterized protein BDV27DRAFT_86415 [Aspergillus caelatus]KAE8357432.1 hypothetical protein BDV27DRAFT_86415 [Aspergillus caelatus]